MLSEKLIFWVQVMWVFSLFGLCFLFFRFRRKIYLNVNFLALLVSILLLPALFLVGRYGGVSCRTLTAYDSCLCEKLDWVQTERKGGRNPSIEELESCRRPLRKIN